MTTQPLTYLKYLRQLARDQRPNVYGFIIGSDVNARDNVLSPTNQLHLNGMRIQ
jgi:hypothetical protein